ncbi:hypothetical protein NVP1263B_09 [Vibrio phage 1.263.B._10N.286.51.B1]|nr:hypothetical protein NVP1263A_09 [Vibrio phage 1.263.A._10N.286.51.B1]AUR99245.1 hypothetical protein NVP1263B_09 [Vibrio phage 1.263.B._10N.286.51.B1]
MKMSDIFEGRVVLDSSCGKVGGGCLEIGDDLGWIAHFGVHNDRDVNESNEAAIHAIYAINNHDRMVEEIADLRKGLKIMIEQFESDHNCEYEYNIIRWNKDLLAKLNQEGEG